MQFFSSPRRFRRALIICLGLGLAMAQTNVTTAQQTQNGLSLTNVIIAPGTVSESITIPPTATVVAYEEPLHGMLVPKQGGFDYFPDPGFWAVGRDLLVMEVVTGRPETPSTKRWNLIAGSLAPIDNTVYSTSSGGTGGLTQPWIFHDANGNSITQVPGVVAPVAYEMTIDNSLPDQPSMMIIHDNTAGHQQTSEHTVNVSVDDLDIHEYLQLGSQVSFYRILQNNQTIVELKAQYDSNHGVWQVRPTTPGNTTFPPTDVHPGFHQVKLVRWGTLGASGADFYINGQSIGTLNDLPLMTLGPETHELILTETYETDGLRMRFEEPTLVVGQSLTDGATLLREDGFDDQFTNSVWDQVSGQRSMSYSLQTLAGFGQQLDIDLASIPHWEHAYLREDFLTEPLDNFKARFWMDPSLVNLPEGGQLRVVYGCTNSAVDWCVSFRLIVAKVDGAFELRLHTWDDVGGEHIIATPFSLAPHFVEIQFQTGVAPGLPTGWAKLWVDGTAVGVSEQLDNANKKIEDVRIGTNYTASTSTGILSLDEVTFWID